MSKTKPIISDGVLKRVIAAPRGDTSAAASAAARGDTSAESIGSTRDEARGAAIDEQTRRTLSAVDRLRSQVQPHVDINFIVSQCKDNIENKNKFIDIFMNHFLNCDKIIQRTKNNTNDTDIKNYFLGLFNYSKDVLKTFPKYEEYTTNYKKYIADPDIKKILEGLSVTKNVPTDNLIQVPDIVKPQILNTQRTYNEKIGITTDLVTETDERTGDAFERSIYNYIDGFIGRDDELKTAKFIIVNNITNLDSGVSIAGRSGVQPVHAARSLQHGSADAGRSGGLADGDAAGRGGGDNGSQITSINGKPIVILDSDKNIVTYISNFQMSCFKILLDSGIKYGFVYGQLTEQQNPSIIYNIFLIFDNITNGMTNLIRSQFNKKTFKIGVFYNDIYDITNLLRGQHDSIIVSMNENEQNLFTIYIVQHSSNSTTIEDIHAFTYIREHGKINIYKSKVQYYTNTDNEDEFKRIFETAKPHNKSIK